MVEKTKSASLNQHLQIKKDKKEMSDANNTSIGQPKATPTVSGLKAPSKIARPAAGLAIPKPTGSTGSRLSSTANSMTTSNSNSTSTLNMTTDEAVSVSASSSILAKQAFADIFEFKVNDRVWLNGAKPGTIAYVGTTGFKEGDWVGLILDTPEGKNNGTVDGRAYFVTEEKRGVFCRPSKITPTQMSEAEANAFSVQQEAKYAKLTAEPVKTAPAASAAASSSLSDDSGLKVGDQVVINNTDGSFKIGTLRFLGETEFAKGVWAGVELNEKIGKNDGSVANKRYFQCEPLFGVFAPVGKVQLYNESLHGAKSKPAPGTVTRPAPVGKLATPSSSRLSTAGRLNKERSGSQESLMSERSSIYSTASAALARPQAGAMGKACARPATGVVKTQTPSLANQTPTAAKKVPLQAMTPAALQVIPFIFKFIFIYDVLEIFLFYFVLSKHSERRRFILLSC